MPKKRKIGYTSIGIPIHTKNRLQKYGKFGESWDDLLNRLLNEMDELKQFKERYRLK